MTMSGTRRTHAQTPLPTAVNHRRRGPDSEPVISLASLHVSFMRGGRAVHALRGITLDVMPGEIVGLVGESGSGKSVLGLTLLGLLPERPRPDVSGSAVEVPRY